MATVYLTHVLKHDRDVAIKDASGHTSNGLSLYYDVSPDGQRLVL